LAGEKFTQNEAQTEFGQNEYATFTEGKKFSEYVANPVIFIKLSKVNNRPKGENSPNRVTLAAAAAAHQRDKALAWTWCLHPPSERHMWPASSTAQAGARPGSMIQYLSAPN
jgi:hypothetical protein